MGENGKTNIKLLEKKAIKAALKGTWKVAVEVNEQILEVDAGNTKAKMRLGKAYLQLKKFKEAEKIFKAVLKADPINTIAKKNLEFAKSKKVTKTGTLANAKFVKEPGTSVAHSFFLSAPRLKASSFTKGEEFGYRTNVKSVSIVRKSKVIGNINDGKLSKALSKASKEGISVSVEFRKGKENSITVMFKADKPAFKVDKQDIKPYFKKGLIDATDNVS
jgi:tetratricopeptide (TPR) repeat protein